MIEKLLAAVVLAACVAMLLRLALPARHRWRLDAGLRRAWEAVRRVAWRARHWRSWRAHSRRSAEDAIERARRRSGERDGNVYKPDAFRGPRKPH